MLRSRVRAVGGFAAGLVVATAGSAQNLLSNPGFEGGLSPWFGSGCQIERVQDAPFVGDYAVRSFDRNNWTSGPRIDITGVFPSGTTFLFTGAIRLDGPSDDSVQLKFRIDDGGSVLSQQVAKRFAMPGEWTTLRGIHRIEYAGPQPDLSLLLQTRDFGEEFSGDDISVTVYEEDPEWRTLSDAGIEAHRTRDMSIAVVDAFGETVAGQLVVQQVRHRFAFGATIEAPEFEAGNQAYIDMFPALFQWATPRNAFKWKQTERNRDALTWSRPDTVVAFCNANGISLYGHNIFWGKTDAMPDWAPALDDNRLRVELEERIDDLLGRYAGDVDYWDVNNEMLHVSYLKDRFGQNIRDWMFTRAAELDPGAVLMLNDFNVVGGGGIGAEAESYVDHAFDFMSRGIPVGGMGAQCHFGERPIIARWLRDRLDVLAATGLPIRLTEFDLVRPDVNDRADDLEKFYRVAFSHPSVDGITLWGWWAGNHGKGPDAAIVNNDFTLNAAGQRYLDLLDEWTTSFVSSTGRGGVVDARGFHGTYEVSFDAPGFDDAPLTFELVPGAGVQQEQFVAIGSCTGDMNADGASDVFDLLAIARLIDSGDPRVDLDGSGRLDAGDFPAGIDAVVAGCP